MSTLDVPTFRRLPQDDRDRILDWLTDVIGEPAEPAHVFAVTLGEGVIDVCMCDRDNSGRCRIDGAGVIARRVDRYPCSTLPPVWPGLSTPSGFPTQ